MPPPAPSAAPLRRSPPRAAPATEPVVEDAAQPGAFAVFMHTLPRYLPQVLQDAEQSVLQLFFSLAVLGLLLAGLFATILAVTALVPLPAGISLHRDQFYRGLKFAVGGTEPIHGLETPANFTASPEWESFLAENTEKLAARLRDTQHPYSINRHEFETALAVNNKMHDDDMRVKLNEFREHVMFEAKRIVEEGNSATLMKANSILEDSPFFKVGIKQISTHALTQALYERHRLMTQVNFLSPGMGAIVNPWYTSKSASPNRRKSWLAWYWMKTEETTAPMRPPIAALMSWDEATQCWCAQHSEGPMGKAQLTVQLGHTIVPSKFYIEHVPAEGTLDISSAPKQFAVWAKANSTAEAARARAIQVLDTEYQPAADAICGQAPRGEKDWVCILTGEYDIHARHHVQEFHFWYRDFAWIHTDKLSVRVTENWGAEDHTCLYRVRVTGEKV